MNTPHIKLHVWAFGLAWGIFWGLSIFIMGLVAMAGYWVEFVTAVGKYYHGYQATLLGSVIGGIWGFVDFFVGGVVIAWLYNLFTRCCKCKEKSCNDKLE